MRHYRIDLIGACSRRHATVGRPERVVRPSDRCSRARRQWPVYPGVLVNPYSLAETRA
jgi:hypothetical protein